MPTREIVRDEWGAFFTSFNRVHDGWLSTLEVMSPSLGVQIEAHNLRFAGIGTVRPREPLLRIALGDAQGAHVSHDIDAPEHVWIKQSEEGADEALEIEGANMKTLLTFRVAALPETVDGVV